MVSRPFQQILRQDSELQSLAQQLERYRWLQALWQKAIPAEWQDGTDALTLEQGVLTVGVFHPALSLRLRQMEPSLVRSLQAELPELDQIRFKTVLPPTLPPTRQPAANETLSAETVEAFAQLARDMEPSPLKESLLRLVRSRRK
jgi:hypothetical protein